MVSFHPTEIRTRALEDNDGEDNILRPLDRIHLNLPEL